MEPNVPLKFSVDHWPQYIEDKIPLSQFEFSMPGKQETDTKELEETQIHPHWTSFSPVLTPPPANNSMAEKRQWQESQSWDSKNKFSFSLKFQDL